ncbi:MAG: hypothetical protein AUG51_16310 [Acidobacteria bacterium 13_1_20CM_3_53_8]|nr:MAG: hypothetical protein AUG51_16310 [Acidobacteria bacterium 13_1_20CM_3_53_8]
MLDVVTWIVGIAATVFAVYEYYKFATFPDRQGGTHLLWYAIAATVVAFACALIFFVRRVNKEEEIHITQ